jgi:hypothetical protein
MKGHQEEASGINAGLAAAGFVYCGRKIAKSPICPVTKS